MATSLKKEGFKFIYKSTLKYILLSILVTIYFFNANHIYIKNFLKKEIIFPIAMQIQSNNLFNLDRALSIINLDKDKFYNKKQDHLIYLLISDGIELDHIYELVSYIKSKELSVEKNFKNLDLSNQLFYSTHRDELSNKFQVLPSDVNKNDFYQYERTKRTQTCRRLELLLLNSKFMIYGKNFFGVRQDKLTREWNEFRSKKCMNEKLKHPHSILFEIIHYFGLIFFVLIIFSYGVYLFFTQSYTTILILGILLSPSGIGSLTSSSYSILLSLIIGICVKIKDKKMKKNCF